MFVKQYRTLCLILSGFATLAIGVAAQEDRRITSNGLVPPPSRVEEVTDTLHGVSIADPYRWLERQDDPETRAWIEAQNAYAESVVPRSPLRTQLEKRLRALMNRPDIGEPQRAGSFEYFMLRRPDEDVPVLRRRPVPTPVNSRARGRRHEWSLPIDPSANYEAVIDPHPLSADHTTRIEIQALESNGHRLIYAIRDGGQDEVQILVRDLRSGTDLGDRLPSSLYGGCAFGHDGAGFFYVRRSRQIGPRVFFHRFGNRIEEDVVVFGDGYGPEHFITMMPGPGVRSRLYAVQKGWTSTEVFLQTGEPGEGARPIVAGTGARFYPQVVDGRLWMRTDLDAPNNRIVVVDVQNPARNRWRTVIPESPDVMDDFRVIGDNVFVTYLHNVSSVIRVFRKDGTPTGGLKVPPFHSASLRGAGPGQVLLTLESFATPRAGSLVQVRTGKARPVQSTEVPWNSSDITVEQAWFNSKDGTRVPMFLVHRGNLPRDGNLPVLLHGYGGFYAASKPSFNELAAVWVEAGGVYAVANIRGGSEFGESWHRAGMLLNKQTVFDDFLSAAEWLVTQGYTNPKRLAIWGVSNGGLLMGAALTQRPDLFRAVLCRFPDVDILRFYEYSTVNNIPALPEYGDARMRDQFEAIRKYSPYQNVRSGTRYPAVMIVSGDLDTRVPPLSARKLTARLQAASSSEYPVILHYRPKAGHATGNGLSFNTRVADTAMELAFLMDEVGLAFPTNATAAADRH